MKTFCGKAYGKAAESVVSLQQMVKEGTITLAEYEQKIESMKNQ